MGAVQEFEKFVAVVQLFKKIGFDLMFTFSRDDAFFTWPGRLFHAMKQLGIQYLTVFLIFKH